LKGLFKYIVIPILISNHLYAFGINVYLYENDSIISKAKLLSFNYLKKNSGTDYFVFETGDNKVDSMVITNEEQLNYYLDAISVECASGKIKNHAIDLDGKIKNIISTMELYTALDSKGNMVGEKLREEDGELWGESRSIFKGSASQWVNIDFMNKNDEVFNYLFVKYNGYGTLKIPIKDIKLEDKGDKEDESQKFNINTMSISIYQWNGDTWIKLASIPPLPAGHDRRYVAKIANRRFLKFRLTIPSGDVKIDSVKMANIEDVLTRSYIINGLPVSLNIPDSKYYTLPSGKTLSLGLNIKQNRLCLLKVTGYFEPAQEKRDIPKSFDDIIKRFLSRIKFWYWR